MRRLLIGSICLISAACGGREVTTPVEASASSAAAAAAGFDRFGYNKAAMMFNGVADGIDRKLDGKLWGSPSAYAGDRLVMKWNAEWERGNREGWSKPPYRAWLNNQWSGARAGGSGSVWHYKYKWVGRCGADYTPLPSGGYCIWGTFEVIQDHGIDPAFDSGHMWFARSVPGGYGR